MMTESGKIMKEVASRVNQSLKFYESDYVSVQRHPEVEKERCITINEFMERRFNYESFKVPELHDALQLTGGKLFYVSEIEDFDEVKRKFRSISMQVINEDSLSEEDENLKCEIAKVKEFLGGSIIKFNSVKQKIKLTITNE